ncbi:hypothetical protein AMYX_20030 [Anaeromyxobacter diazotrophicus]|uniref:Uncharacterized protein n=1 Tax=Anaeromyxobacter diazotrophicus TaxID=2590199 RepID=A0A7I9VLH3_9BACT|nr:hypothetical protein AMYX_20030 [Anaeromyxobacter diazotrophicus]
MSTCLAFALRSTAKPGRVAGVLLIRSAEYVIIEASPVPWCRYDDRATVLSKPGATARHPGYPLDIPIDGRQERCSLVGAALRREGANCVARYAARPSARRRAERV